MHMIQKGRNLKKEEIEQIMYEYEKVRQPKMRKSWNDIHCTKN